MNPAEQGQGASGLSGSDAAVVGISCFFDGAPDVAGLWKRILDATPHVESTARPPENIFAPLIRAALGRSVFSDCGGLEVFARARDCTGLANGLKSEGLGARVTPCGDSDVGPGMVEKALEALKAGGDRVIVAAFESGSSPVFTRLARSSAGRLRAYADNADGTLPAWGACALLLRPLQRAREDGDRIFAVLRAAESASGVHPGRALEAAIRRVLESAGWTGEDIDLIEGHGSGDPDEATLEIQAIRAVCGKEGWPGVSLGSVKSSIGHTGMAADLAGLAKASLALYHRVLPPTASVEKAHPLLAGCRGLPNTTPRPWISPPGRRRRAAVYALGPASGSCFLLEEAPEAASIESLTPRPAELFLLSAANRDALADRLQMLEASVQEADGLAAPAAVESTRFESGAPLRLAIVAGAVSDFEIKARRALSRLESSDGGSWVDSAGVYFGAEPFTGRVAFIFGGIAFPGLTGGSTKRFGELCLHFPAVRRILDAADGAPGTRDDPPYPLRHQFFPPALLDVADLSTIEKELALSPRTVIGMFASYLAGVELMNGLGVRPDMAAGFSLGEWGALQAAGAIDINDLLAAEQNNGDVAWPSEEVAGIWAMVGAPQAEVEALLEEMEEDVTITVDLSPDQVFIGGGIPEVRAAMKLLAERGIWVHEFPFVLPNPVHTPALNPWVERTRRWLGGIPVNPPDIPVYCGMTGRPYPKDAEALRDLLARMPVERVRLKETFRGLYDAGTRLFIQVGTGGGLGPLIHAALSLKPHTALSLDSEKRGGLEQVLHLAGRLAAMGVPIDPAVLFEHRFIPERPHRAVDRLTPGKEEPRTEPRADLLTAPLNTLRRFLDVEAAAEEGDRRLMEAFLHTQQMCTRALSESPPRSDGRTAVAPAHGPLVGKVFSLVPGRELRSRLLLDLDEHPFLAHHLFIRAPGHLRPPESCLPTLPMTFGMEMIAEAAAALNPKRSVHLVRDVVAARWVSLVDRRRLPVEIRAYAAGENEAEIKIFTEESDRPVYTGVAVYGPPRPAPQPMHTASLRPCPHSARELYTEGPMFHGPLFHAVSRLEGFDDEGIAGTLTTRGTRGLFASEPSIPMIFDPVVLDGLGQLAGYRALVDGPTVFPVRVGRAEVFGPTPPPGTEVRAVVRRAREEGRFMVWDLDAVGPDGALWMRVQDWTTWRTLWKPEVRCFFFEPTRRALGEIWPMGIDGALAVRVRASQLGDMAPDWAARTFLREDEWQRWQSTRSEATLLGYIAAKEAVRAWLRLKGQESVHPLEIGLAWEESGAPHVIAPSGTGLNLSIAHTSEEALALVAAEASGAGCDLVPVAQRDPAFAPHALDTDERRLLSVMPGGPEWIARLFAAKEAAVKVQGRGYGSLPACRVVEVDKTAEIVRVVCKDGATIDVHTAVDGQMVLAFAVDRGTQAAHLAS